MMKEIWLDMDGTIADLYGVENWLEMLMANDPTPYKVAKPLLRLATLARLLNRLQADGYTIGIVSWLSKGSSAEYDKLVTEAKKEWLHRHLASVNFDRIDIIAYGTPKEVGRTGILFDDEKRNRDNWSGVAYDVTEILEVLRRLESAQKVRKI